MNWGDVFQPLSLHVLRKKKGCVSDCIKFHLMESDEESEELPLVVETNRDSTEALMAFVGNEIFESMHDMYTIKSCEREVMTC